MAEVDAAPLLLVLAAVMGYLLGSVPFGLLLTRFAGLGDIRSIGSGNIGATNVLRTGNKPLALATLLLDGGKGAVAALVFGQWGTLTGLFAGVAAVLGHNFPVWLRFKGGKGVATTLGTTLALAWPAGLAACAIWLAMAAVFRISSLAALTALAALPFLMGGFAGLNHAVAGLVLTLVGFFRHKDNIRRLLAGTEPRIGGGKAGKGTANG
ncbi:MAG: glycerol-3-phosphate 1-O-acyltransferase PlsY [Defluviicoccus sp.]|nr:glycerol-3-phosphate 1-O-acyltransferase PlsY [Defluviicoccus sp.]MDG4608049.1 glycerol-3-phosphate 1-O-acyltransferase PlsY [Defluviicoccus sp.]